MPGLTRSSAFGAGISSQIVRTLWFDNIVHRALDSGVRQVIILGAGYDTRSARLARNGVRYFEVDHPATQSDKLRRLRPQSDRYRGVTFCPIDLITDGLGPSLRSRGFEDLSTVVLCEGLLRYLPEEAVYRMLLELHALVPDGTILAATVPLRGSLMPAPSLAGVVLSTARSLLSRWSGEMARFDATPDSIAVLLGQTGWRRRELQSPAALAVELLDDRRFEPPPASAYAFVTAERA